jgi:hypothetical protein
VDSKLQPTIEWRIDRQFDIFGFYFLPRLSHGAYIAVLRKHLLKYLVSKKLSLHWALMKSPIIVPGH